MHHQLKQVAKADRLKAGPFLASYFAETIKTD